MSDEKTAMDVIEKLQAELRRQLMIPLDLVTFEPITTEEALQQLRAFGHMQTLILHCRRRRIMTRHARRRRRARRRAR